MSAPDVGLHDADRPYPPIGMLSTGALTTAVIGGILLASFAPRRAPLTVVSVLFVLGLVLLAAAWTALFRVSVFSWTTFRNVFKWALLAYVVTSGIIEFAFVRDQVRGATLTLVTGLLAVFALSVPTTIAFTVARFATPDQKS